MELPTITKDMNSSWNTCDVNFHLPLKEAEGKTLVVAAWVLLLGQYGNSNEVAFDIGQDGQPWQTLKFQITRNHSISEFLNGVREIIHDRKCGTDETKCSSSSCVVFGIQHNHDPPHLTRTTDSNSLHSLALKFSHWPPRPEDEPAHITSDRRVWTAVQTTRLVNQFQHVLGQLMELPQIHCIEDLELASPHDKEEILRWNSVPPILENSCIHTLVDAQARQRPDVLAISSSQSSVTYATLKRLSDLFREKLRFLGLKPGGYVPICCAKSVIAKVAMLAVLKAGGCCVVLDVNHPDQHLYSVIKAIHSPILIHSTDQESRFQGLDVRKYILSLDSLQNADFTQGDVSRGSNHIISPKDIAFAVFTSGSTGTPKGILLSHQALASSVTAQALAMNINSETRALQFSSYAFDISIYEVFLTLTQGGSLFVPSETERLGDLATYINSNGITWAILTPSLVSILTPERIPGLRTLNLTGECPRQENLDTWAHRVYLVNAYGSAEASTCSPAVLSSASPPNFIGTPVGARGWIVDPDDHRKLAPIGAIGELVVEGYIVASGYLGNESQSRVAFIEPPPWAQEVTNGLAIAPRFFKMGDLVQYHNNGSMLYLGRKDTQVRLHGQRVDAMDVEFRIRTLAPDIKSVAVDVISHAESKSSTVLVAFLTYNHTSDHRESYPIPLTGERKDALIQLRRSLEQQLPSYMVPNAFIVLDSVPMLLTSKINRKYLKRMGTHMASDQFVQYLLQNDQEDEQLDMLHSSTSLSIVKELWSSILGLPPGNIKGGDNFFHCGGDSIKAMQMMSVAQKQGYILDYKTIFRRPTANQLAQVFESATAKTVSLNKKYEPFSLLKTDDPQWRESLLQEIEVDLGIPKSSQVVDSFPCTPLQEGILALSIKQEGTFLAQNVLRLRSSIDLDHFQVAWAVVVANTDALRTRFIHSVSQGMIQIIVDEPLEWIGASELQEYLNTDKQKPFILGGPTSRFALLLGPNAEQYFIWTAHHAIYDAWTLSLLMGEVSRIYEGQSPSIFPPFAGLVRHILHNDQSPSKRYWKAKFSDLDIRDFPEIPSADYEVVNERRTHYRMPIEVGSHSDTTLATRIQAAWALLLATYTRSNDVVFGQNMSGRNATVSEIDRMIGLVATTVPVRIKLDRSWSVAQLLNAMQMEMTELASYQHYGLQNIARLSDDGKRACQFRNLLIIDPQEESLDADSPDHIVLRTAHEGEISSRAYPLHIRCTPTANSILIETRYDGDIIDELQCQRLLWQLEHVIHQLQKTEMPIGSIETASPADREQLKQWHSLEPSILVNQCVQEFITMHALSYPRRTAIDGWDRSFSYDDLESLSDALAHYLLRLGASGTMIPLSFTKSAWTVIALLAVLKSGAAFVPLDPSHPTDRLREICGQAQAKLILVSPSEVQRFKGFVEQVVGLDDDFAAQLSKRTWKLPKVRPEAAAYVIFTSGTTGKPKGVVITHSNLSSSVGWQGRMMEVASTTRALQFASYAFDAMILETVLILAHGGCVCVPSPEDRLQVAEVIRRMDINWAALNPSVARTVDPETVPLLKTLVVGGEPLSRDLIDIWASRISLVNMYGPTECCVFCSGTRVDPSMPDSRNIGRCMNSKGWVVNSENHYQLTPIGAVGELVLEGPIVGRGYLGDQKKTDDVFINHPGWLGKPSSAKVYKTGDLVSFRSDGTLSIVGRKDTQVKVRGNRIELGDIEHHIKQFFLPNKAFVVLELVGESSQRKQLAAFYSTSDEFHTSDSLEGLLIAQTTVANQLEQLVTHLCRTLPEYMVPALWIGLHRVPLTTSGKVNRRVLLALAATAVEQQYGDQKGTVTSLAEQTIAEAWSKALSIDSSKIGPDDNLFSLGGDSITAMKLSAMFRQLGYSITVGEIFQHATLSEMAKLVDTRRGLNGIDKPRALLVEPTHLAKLRAEAVEIYAIPQDQIRDIYPCTPLQNALLILSIQEPGSYVCQLNFTLPEDVDISRFQASWDIVAAHHDILRTTYMPSSDGNFHQIVLDIGVGWTTSSDMQIENFLEQDAKQIMHPGVPMVRLAIVSKHFVLTIHHASYDGWVLPRILHDVESVYAGVSPEPSISIKSFVEHITLQPRAHAIQFWKNQLSGSRHTKFPRLPSPTYRPRADGVIERYDSFKRRSDSAITTATIIRAAWALVVARYSDSEDIVFGVTTNGRGVSLPGIEHVMGPTIATMPVRVAVPCEQHVMELLRQVQDQAAQMLAFEHFGMHNIRQACPEAGEAGEFQNLLAINASLDKSPSRILSPQNLVGEQTNFHTIALTLECTIDPNGVTSKAYFDSRAIEREQVSRVLGQLGCAIIQLSEEDPSKRIRDVNLTSNDDIRDIMRWHEAHLHPVEGSCVHEQTEERAKLQPEASAICAWDGEFTYQALATISTQIAKTISKHVSPGSPVTVCFEKSAWAIITMLAVLKAGAAYVPLDPTSPRSRLETIIGDLKCKLILCSENMQPRLSDLDSTVISIGPSLKGLGVYTADDAVVLPKVPPHNPAFILFTSGSTGKPKGIVIEHQGFCYGARHHGDFFNIGRHTRVFQFASHTFDISFSDIFTTLIRGGCVCVPSDHDRVNNLAGVITKMNANYAFLTPTVANTLKPENVMSLRTLVIGGEAPTQDVLRRWSDNVNLIVVWGPAECTVYSTGHKHTRGNDNPAGIGSPIGAHVWLTEPDNPNRLAPIGTVGELLVEGPIVAKGYFNDPEKTGKAFIINPDWTKLQNSNGGLRRFYRTADMGRYLSDGSILFVGRRDNQVKVRGQRVELPEIEHQARAHASVEHFLALYPRHGPFKDHLTAIFTLSYERQMEKPAESFELLSPESMKVAAESITEHLGARVPTYMVPTTFIGVESIPLMPSGKLNRAMAVDWLLNMDEDLVTRLRIRTGDNITEPPQSAVEEKLHLVWSRCLGIATNEIGRNSLFLSLGGDSISAMQIVSKCKAELLEVSVQDILQCKTISKIATRVKHIKSAWVEKPVGFMASEKTLNSLSPMQNMFFRATKKLGSCRFNQSFLLSLQSQVSPDQLRDALQSIIKTHSVLRSRFSWDTEKHEWLQRISESTEGSYHLSYHSELSTSSDVFRVIEETQQAVNIECGPVLSASLSNLMEYTNRPSQILFLTCHHLVIDLVSWRIILEDLESLLRSSDHELPPQSTTFAAWNSLIRRMKSPSITPEELPASCNAYWGLIDNTSTYKDHVLLSFTLNKNTEKALLGVCNQAFNTEPVELMLAALIHSFKETFVDRSPPVIFYESHGRHPLLPDVDLSRTVGWFTTMYPVTISSPECPSLLETIRRTKDTLRNIPQRDKLSVGPLPMEILFNYSGRYQQLTRSDSLFHSYELPDVDLDSMGVDQRMQRFALIDISVSDLGNCLNFGFRVDRRMPRMNQIKDWVAACERTLVYLPDTLAMQPQPTLTDYPLLQTYHDLDHIFHKGFEDARIGHIDTVEDVYPCTPLQEQMLIANQHDSRLYIVRSIWELTAHDGVPFDPLKFEAAWVEVVRRHDILRTRFVAGAVSGHYQVVLRKPATIVKLWKSERLAGTETLMRQPSLHLNSSECPHRWDLVIESDGRVYAQLQICHAIIDGLSVAILHHELSCFYQGVQPPSKPTPFKSFVNYLQTRPTTADDQYWSEYLSTAEPCYVGAPSIDPKLLATRQRFRIQDVNVIRPGQLLEFCSKKGVTPSIVFQTAWAMVLRHFSTSDNVCFGYVVAGRSAWADGDQDAIGPFINFLSCRENISTARTYDEVMDSLQTSFLSSQSHQYSSVNQVYQEAATNERQYNTVVNFQGSTMNEKDSRAALRFIQIFAEDPMEWDLLLRVVKQSEDKFAVTLEYWEPNITADIAASIGVLLNKTLQSIVG